MATSAWGLDRFDAEYEYSHVLDSDVISLVREIKEVLGRTTHEVAARGNGATNPFGRGSRGTQSRMPWVRVEEDGMRDLETFIRTHCTMRAA